MLLQVTRMCKEECKHCFASPSPDGPHMELETVDAFLDFYKRIKPAPLKWITDVEYPTLPTKFVITGGEPTEHPFLDTIIEKISVSIPTSQIIIETNGMWLGDTQKEEMVAKILDIENVKLMLATAHHKFYPRYAKFMLQKDALVEFGFKQDSKVKKLAAEMKDGEVIETGQDSKLLVDPDWMPEDRILYLGRAKNLVPTKQARENNFHPNCLHLLFMANECKSFAELFAKLELRGRYGDPIISVEGNIHIGVCQDCMVFGNVKDTNPEVLFQQIQLATPCDGCGLMSNVPPNIVLQLQQMQKYGILGPGEQNPQVVQ